jgi:hypothetical protein
MREMSHIEMNGKVAWHEVSVCVVHISATRWPFYTCPLEKEGNSKYSLKKLH